MHLGKAKHANAGVAKLPALKMALLDKAAHASRRLTRTFRDATWPFADSANAISILSKMRCLACAAALSVGPGTQDWVHARMLLARATEVLHNLVHWQCPEQHVRPFFQALACLQKFAP